MSYERQMAAIRDRTRAALAELKTAVGTHEMSEKEKIRFARLNASYSALIQEDIGGSEVLASAIASVKATPETLASVGYGAL